MTATALAGALVGLGVWGLRAGSSPRSTIAGRGTGVAAPRQRRTAHRDPGGGDVGADRAAGSPDRPTAGPQSPFPHEPALRGRSP